MFVELKIKKKKKHKRHKIFFNFNYTLKFFPPPAEFGAQLQFIKKFVVTSKILFQDSITVNCRLQFILLTIVLHSLSH